MLNCHFGSIQKKIDEKTLKNPKPTLNPINLEPIINPGNEFFALQNFVKIG
jgi:hypothetical protein